jgi:Flp pilus assembly protein TadG
LITPITSRFQFKSRLLHVLRSHAHAEQGQTLVETAISMLVMLSLVFGVIEVCWAVYSFHYLGNAAHEAARYAIVRGGSWTGTCDGTGSAGSGYSSSQCQASPTDIANFVASRD